MLDEKDLQAIAKLMDTKLTQQKSEIMSEVKDLVDTSIKDSESRMMAYFEADIMPKFDLLAEGQETILDRLDRVERKLEDLEPMERRLSALESVVRQHSRQIAELKKAQ